MEPLTVTSEQQRDINERGARLVNAITKQGDGKPSQKDMMMYFRPLGDEPNIEIDSQTRLTAGIDANTS